MGNWKYNHFTGRLDKIGSTSTGGTPLDNHRSGTQSLLASGSHSITFSSALADAGYTLQVQCYSGITSIAYRITSQSASGFTLEVSQACTLKYTALKYL